MNNPFDDINARLSNIENLLLEIKHGSITAGEQASVGNPLVFGMKVCSEVTGYSPSSIYQRTSKGLIPCFRRDGRLMFRRDEILNWLTECRVKTQGEFSQELDKKLINKKNHK